MLRKRQRTNRQLAEVIRHIDEVNSLSLIVPLFLLFFPHC
jgi:hypothetical protein